MSFIAKNLADLTAAVGAGNIARLPALENVEVVTQSEDEDAFSHKIFYGMGRGIIAEPDLSKVWIYLLTSSNRPHELKFVIYLNNDESSNPSVVDSQSVVRRVKEQSGQSIAFGNVTSYRKIQSLAKYYFLALMNHIGSKDEALKQPFNLSKTWVEELKAVCLDFPPQPMPEALGKLVNGTTSRKRAQCSLPVLGPDSAQSFPIPKPNHGRTRSERIINHMTNKQGRENSSPLSTPSDPPTGFLDIGGEEQLDLPRSVGSKLTGGTSITGVHRAKADMHRPATLVHREHQPTIAQSPTPSMISLRASSITIAATPTVPRTREQNIDTFNYIRTREIALGEDKRTVHEKKKECMEAMQKLQGEIDVLGKEEAGFGKAFEEIKVRKRHILSTMSYEEQLDFMFEAGEAAAGKRSRLD